MGLGSKEMNAVFIFVHKLMYEVLMDKQVKNRGNGTE